MVKIEKYLYFKFEQPLTYCKFHLLRQYDCKIINISMANKVSNYSSAFTRVWCMALKTHRGYNKFKYVKQPGFFISILYTHRKHLKVLLTH